MVASESGCEYISNLLLCDDHIAIHIPGSICRNKTEKTYLPVLSRRATRHLAQSLDAIFHLLDLAQSKLAAVPGRSSGQGFCELQIIVAVAVAIWWSQGRLSCRTSRRICGSQNRRDVQRRLWWSQLSDVRWKMRGSTASWRGGRGVLGCGRGRVDGRRLLGVRVIESVL